MPSIDRYYAAACQTDLPCPATRAGLADRGDHPLQTVDHAVHGYSALGDVRLVVFPVADTQIGKLGAAICHDLIFPETIRQWGLAGRFA